MLNCLLNINKNICKIQLVKYYSQTVIRHKLNMNTVYVKYETAATTFQLTFHLIHGEYGIDRIFNFNRNITETVSVLRERITTNLQKEICKSNKKKFRIKNKAVKVEEEFLRLPNDTIQLLLLTSNDSTIADCKDDLINDGTQFSEILTNENVRDKLKMKILNQYFTIVINYPICKSISLPTIMMIDCYVHPVKLEIEFGNVNDASFIWYRGLMKPSKNDKDIQWEEIDNKQIYKLKPEDLNYKLKIKCTPKNNHIIGPSVEYISENIIQLLPNDCPFIKRHEFTTRQLQANEFRIVTYNLLADYYCDGEYAQTELFNYCPIEYLNINYRKQLYIKEIIEYNADIICLQEVDRKIFEYDLKPILWNAKLMNGIFKNKGTSPEGLSIFYNTKRFELIHEFNLNIGENLEIIQEFSNVWQAISLCKHLKKRITDLGTTVQVAVLKSLDNGKLLIIANTHLYFHPDADHIRLLQMGVSMLYVEKIYNQIKEEFNICANDVKNELSIIFCGDFNSVPECGIYKLMTEKFVGNDYIDFKNYTDEELNIDLKQPFNFKSTYTNFTYSNYTELYAGWLDYTFYQTDNLNVIQIVPIPTEDVLKANRAIPSKCFPSDHVALISDLQWIR